MDDELIYLTDEDVSEEDYDNILETDMDVEETEHVVTAEETVEVVEVALEEEINIEVDEAIGWVGGDSTRHYSLCDRDEADQHPITAITGLREELDNIEALKVVYSNARNQADYYLWEDENILQENRVGYFVSACSDINKIKICTSNNDVFGVTVDGAGFIGAQSDVARDIKYGLVVTTGLVHVRCEQSVEVGDYVISNDYGYAQKNTIGYKVTGRHVINGIECAEITLVTPIGRMCELSDDVEQLKDRMDDAEVNIVAAMNVANAAYNKANDVIIISENASKTASDASTKADNAITSTERLDALISSANEVSAQAKAIAESAIVSAESIRQEAVKKANEALTKNSELRDEFEKRSFEIDAELDNVELELESTKENIISTTNTLQENIDETVDDIKELAKDLEPLAVWPNNANPSGIAGFVARADEDSATLASITKFEGEFGRSIAGFVQEATKENATVKAIASYQEKDKDGNPYGPSGVSVLMGLVDANKASIDTLASLEGDGFSGLSGLTAQVNKNASSVTTLASHVVGEFENTDDWVEDGKDITKIYYAKNNRQYYYYNQGWKSTDKAYKAGLTGSIAGVQQIADDNKAQLDAMVAYDKDGKSALAGLTAYVDDNSARINTLASYKNDNRGTEGVAGLVADVNKNISELSLIANHTFTKNDGSVVNGLAGLNAYVNENESNVALMASRVKGKYVVVPKYPEGDQDKINALDTHKIYYTVWSYKDNGVTKYVVRIWIYQNSGWNYVQSFGTFITQYPDILLKDTVYYFGDKLKYYAYYKNKSWSTTSDPDEAGLPSSVAGIQVAVDDNSSQIDQLVSWSSDTADSMASIEQKANDNGASIELMVSSVDKYSVGKYSQSYGLTREEAASILKPGCIYIPTNNFDKCCDDHSKIDSHCEIMWENAIEKAKGNKGKKEPQIFTPGYYYVWGVNDQNKYDWIEHSTQKEVVISSIQPSNSSGTYEYWYIDSQTAPIGYEPYTLYIWENNKWKKVNTLAGNASNRITSLIRQTADKIAIDVVNTQESIASHQQWLEDNSANIQYVVSWKTDVESDVSNIATIKQTADAAGSSVAQVASRVRGEFVTIDSWSSKGKDKNQVYYVTADKQYRYYKNGEWIKTKYPIEAGLEINAASIVTAVNGDTTGITLNAKHINLNGFVSANSGAFTIDDNGYMTATGGKIGGWNIGGNGAGYKGGIYKDMGNLRIGMKTGSNSTDSAFYVTKNATDADNRENIFYVNYEGKLYAKNADITGKITAETGEIAGFTLGQSNVYSNALYKVNTSGTTRYEVGIKGSDSATSAAFYIRSSTDNWTNSKLEFYVRNDGYLYAENANITGTITSGSGSIGGWTITDTRMYSCSHSTEDNSTRRMVLGSYGYDTSNRNAIIIQTRAKTSDDWVSKFRVRYDGTVKATDATIEGAITATSGVLKNGVYLGTQQASLITSRTDGVDTYTEWKSYSDCSKFWLGEETGADMGYAGIYANQDVDINANHDIYITAKAVDENYMSSIFCESIYMYHNGTTFSLSSGGTTSDITKKHEIVELSESYSTLFDNLIPVNYKYNNGTSNRKHTGFIAQQVDEAIKTANLSTQDFAAVMIDKQGTEDESWYLRYEEFIALNTWQIQKAKKRIAELEDRVAQLESLLKE